MYHSSLWPQGHPRKGQSHSTWLQDECDDPWAGEVVAFSPFGDRLQMVYATLADGSNRVTVVLRNNTRDWLGIKKGVPIAQMVTTNKVLKVTNLFSTEQTKEQSTLTEAERQDLLLEKLDLLGLEAWPEEQAEKARSLLKEYHDVFSLEKRDMGHTNATKHKIVLKDPDTLQGAFCWFSCSFVSKACAGLGNSFERFCASRSLLGSYIHQESI